MNELKKKVLVDMGPIPRLWFFHTNFPICEKKGVTVQISAENAEWYSDDSFGEKGTAFIRRIGERGVPVGLAQISIGAYFLGISYYPAFAWGPLEDVVLAALKAQHAPLKVRSFNMKSAIYRLFS